jgi:tetratricopeptide (TPR) repeat protein
MAENNIGNIYSKQGDYTLAIETYRKSLSQSRFSADKEGEAIAQLNIGTVFADNNDFQTAFKYFNLALNDYQIIRNREGEAVAKNKLGETYLAFGALSDALHSFNSAVETASSYGLNYLLPDIYNNIGLTYFRLNDFENSIKVFEAGLIKIVDESEHFDALINLNNNLGDAYLKSNIVHKAEENYLKAKNIADRFGDGFLSAILQLKLEKIKIETGAENREKQLISLLDYFKELKYSPGELNTLLLLAGNYNVQQETKKGEKTAAEIENRLTNQTSVKNRFTGKFCIIPDYINEIVLNAEVKQHHNFLYKAENIKRTRFIRNLNSYSFNNLNDKIILDSLQKLQREYDFISDEISSELGKKKGAKNKSRLSNLQKRFKHLSQTDFQTAGEILNKNFNLLPLSIESIRERIDDSSVVVSFIPLQDALQISLISKNSFKSIQVDFYEDAINNQVSSLISSISGNDEFSAHLLLNGLYNKFIKPVEKDLSSYKTILFSIIAKERSSLYLLPFHSLINDQGKKLYELKDVKYLSGLKKKSEPINGNFLLVEDFKSAVLTKNELFQNNFGGILFDLPFYLNIDQPSASYISLEKDEDELSNIYAGEFPLIKSDEIVFLDFFSDRNNSVLYPLSFFASSSKIIINRYKVSERTRINFKNEWKKPGFTLNEFLRQNNGSLEYSSFFEYVSI